MAYTFVARQLKTVGPLNPASGGPFIHCLNVSGSLLANVNDAKIYRREKIRRSTRKRRKIIRIIPTSSAHGGGRLELESRHARHGGNNKTQELHLPNPNNNQSGDRIERNDRSINKQHQTSTYPKVDTGHHNSALMCDAIAARFRLSLTAVK
jgi:hypothetical protein